MALLKGRVMFFCAFESGIFLLFPQLITDQSEQSSDYYQCISPELNNSSPSNSLSDFNGPLFTPTRTGRQMKISTLK